jgi:hypothetical protein
MRVKVLPDKEKDAQAVQAAYSNPASTSNVLLFPESQLEFFKWDREDTMGFISGCLLVAVIFGFLYLALRLGG